MASTSAPVMEQLRKMHSLGLYSSTALLSNLTITMAKNCNDLFSIVHQCELLVYQADCMFEDKLYQKAETFYNKALQLYKSVPKNKPKQNILSLQQVVSDVDIRYKIYQCCMLLNNDGGALNVLEGVSQKSRNAKISLALAKLYQKLGMERPAMASYKEVLRSCPLALDCAIELLRLGEHPNVVISIMNITCNLDWLVPYIKAHGIKLNKDFNKSVAAFEALSKRVSLNGNVDILCELANACCCTGNTTSAMQYFKSAHLQDPQRLKGMDLYAYLLCEDEQNEELEKLSTKLFSVSERHPEPWVAFGYHAKSKGDHTKAVYLAARAAELDSSCVQALLLKGVCLRMLGEIKIAITHFRQAMALAPNRLDCYAELVSCYMHERRNNEALNIAKSALDSVGYSPDSVVLCAGALLADSSSYDQAIRLVDRALNMNPNHKQAIEIRCTIAQRQEKYHDAIKLLKSAVQHHGNSVFHTMLANCYFHVSKFSDAVDHYNIAMSLNPNNTEAKDGLDKIHGLEHTDAFDVEQDETFANTEDDEGNRMSGVTWPHDDWF